MPILSGGGPSGLPAPESGLSVLQRILELADSQLQDTTGTKWGAEKLLPYLNLCILEIINLKPDAYPSTSVISLVAGPRQSLPSNAIALIDVECNVDAATGEIAGQVVTFISKEIMDQLIPGWMSYPSSETVSYVVYDPRNPKVFFVFPPQPTPAPSTANKLRVVLSTPHTHIEDTDATFPLDESYEPAVVDYLVFRALAEETTIPNALNKAQSFKNKFLEDLGLKSNVEENQERRGR